MTVFAHSLPERSPINWELLVTHHAHVAQRSAEFAEVFHWREAAWVAGNLHDIGKCSVAVQTYLRGQGPSCDHSTAGARQAVAAYPAALGRMLAVIVAGHHAGLSDGDTLDRRLDPDTTPIPDYAGWAAHAAPLPLPRALSPTRRWQPSRDDGFAQMVLTRMLFSCLVDADFLETERFYAQAEGTEPDRRVGRDLDTLRTRLNTHLERTRAGTVPTPLNALRTRILDHVLTRATLPPGLFTLTVPTGGGKTLTSLSFALDHARAHNLRRIVYVIPYTSIVEQTAAVFEDALGQDAGILEHHAGFDWEAAVKTATDSGLGSEATARLRRAAENWDAPIVVTTAVQFFESLFANRTSRCRKLHNLAGSVIVLDEAQTLPLHLLRPCIAAIEELAANYGASLVLCTATQPALREIDGFEGGLRIDAARELAPNPTELYVALKRVDVTWREGPTDDATLAGRFAEQPQMLCIVNSRGHARTLFEHIRDRPGAIHLTTLMCPRHRRLTLALARARLKDGLPVRIVSTSLIEAGVDIDLPEVWRAAAGLDSIAQAAGRCNREGRLAAGRVVVFEPAEAKPPICLKAFWQAAVPVLRAHADPLGLAAIQAYFTELYWQKGPDAFDAGQHQGTIWPILRHVAERAGTGAYPFETIAQVFRMIDDAAESVVVPWSQGPEDREALTILDRIAAMDHPLGMDLRRLQAYTVSIPKPARDAWLAAGALRPVHPSLGDALLRFADLAHYDPETGLRLDDPMHRSAEMNVLG